METNPKKPEAAKPAFSEIGVFADSLNGKQYRLCRVSAKDLGSYLRASLAGKGIDYAKFNSQDGNDVEANNPPVEIYEYQGFFLLDMPMQANDFVLLDGFRRLLWYNAPDTSVYVRIYKKYDLTNEEVLSLMVRLNHFKFYSDSDYFDRGFALFMKMIFGLDILTYKSAFDSYLSSSERDEDQIRSSYASGLLTKEAGKKNLSVKERILQPRFVSDMAFIEELNERGAMVNGFLGIMTYMFRKKSDLPFSADEFLRIANANPVMPKLMERYKKTGTNTSAESQKAVNAILEIYENVFNQLLGGKAVKSHSELMVECRNISEGIKKDKGWSKMTGSQNIYEIETAMLDKLRDKKQVEFKMVVYPYDDKHKDFHGLAEKVQYKIKYEKFHYSRGKELIIEAKIGKENFKICHNHSGGFGHYYSKKYVYIEREWSLDEKSDKPKCYDIDFFVNITKEEIEDQLRKRFPERYKEKEKPAVEIPEQLDEKINITTKNIRDFVAGKDTVYLNKKDGGMSRSYLCRFKKYEKGMVFGEVISADVIGETKTSMVGQEISARLSNCYLRGKMKETDVAQQCRWFDKDGTIS